MILKAKQILRQPFVSSLTSYIADGVLVGIMTGGIVGIFRWIIDHTMQFLFTIYPILGKHPLYLIPYVLIMAVICIILGLLIKPYLNDLVGSGVPQIEAVFLNENKIAWW